MHTNTYTLRNTYIKENQHTDNNISKPDTSLRSDKKGTLRLMIEYFTKEDNDLDKNNHHKRIREFKINSLTHQTTEYSQEKKSEW